jgi:hypothetical protein
MYGQSRVVLGVLVFAYLLEVCSMVASLVLTLPGIEFDTICLVTSIPTTILIYGWVESSYQTHIWSDELDTALPHFSFNSRSSCSRRSNSSKV